MKLQNTKTSNPNGNHAANTLTTVLFFIYLAILCWILLLKLGVRFSYMDDRRVNVIPFRDYLASHGKTGVSEIILNMLVFVPLGVYAGILFKRWKTGRQIFLVFIISLFVEGLQYFFAIGAFDLTDVTTNTFGGITGLLLLKTFEKLVTDRFRAQKFINLIAAIGTVLVLLFLLLLKMNLLPLRYQ